MCSSDLVDVTAGMVVTYNGQPIEAVYHQSGGGQTENSRDVWGRYVPYLRSVKDYDWDAPMYNWEKALPASEIERRLSTRGYAVGKLERNCTSDNRLVICSNFVVSADIPVFQVTGIYGCTELGTVGIDFVRFFL